MHVFLWWHQHLNAYVSIQLQLFDNSQQISLCDTFFRLFSSRSIEFFFLFCITNADICLWLLSAVHTRVPNTKDEQFWQTNKSHEMYRTKKSSKNWTKEIGDYDLDDTFSCSHTKRKLMKHNRRAHCFAVARELTNITFEHFNRKRPTDCTYTVSNVLWMVN